MGKTHKLNEEFKIMMMKELEMKKLGLMHYFLGMEVHQNNEEIFIYQSKHANDILNKFGMDICKPASILISQRELLYK